MRVNRFKDVLLAATALSALAGAVLAAEFTWTGGGVVTAWINGCNWHTGGPCGLPGVFPDDTGDNATFPWNGSGAWPVDLVVVSINDLTIAGSVDFESYDPPGVPGTNPVPLTVNSLLIAPTEGDIEITIGDRAQIIVAQDP